MQRIPAGVPAPRYCPNFALTRGTRTSSSESFVPSPHFSVIAAAKEAIALSELSHCDTDITPNCLRTLYKIPPGLTKNPQNSLGIVEYSPQSFVPSDLDLFFSNFSRNQVQKRPNFVAIDGGYLNETQDLDLNLESNLDLQFAMALVNPVEVTLYQVGDIEGNASFNDFLDAFDASYCAGDDPSQDMSYPDSAPGGYDKPKQCGGVEQTKVISTSYGYNEVDLTPAYEQRQCNEYAKLGLAGTTFVFSSGDYGVAGNGNMCVSDTTGQLQSGKLGGVFTPGFPGGCPYVLSVGATQINPNASVLAPESACNQVIYSGGGFSNVFSIPTYQKTAVSSWFAQHKPSTYSSKQYNDSGVTRGFPDVSANGARYVVAIDGGYKYHVYGTSASAPTFASVLTLINEARLNVGKPTVGFVNPALYANPSMLSEWFDLPSIRVLILCSLMRLETTSSQDDITSGFNPGCNTKGFEAVQGWDPVTGLGTPNYPRCSSTS
ncbi:hypothetical protein L7F22_025698 [Adiantum nelumboides]|nr:hypothetical protein [Adiantum nelumboides]